MTLSRLLVLGLGLVLLALRPAAAAQVESLGGRLATEPSCVSWSANRIDCFFRSEDSALHHRWWDGARWNFEWLGGMSIASRPECVSTAANRIDCIVVGNDRRLYHRGWDGAQWGGFTAVSEYRTVPPTGGFGCTATSGRVVCLVRAGLALSEYWFDGGSWRSEYGVEGNHFRSPECVSLQAGRVDCFAAGERDVLLHTTWTGGRFSGTKNLGGIMTSGISCTGWENNIDCFVRGTDHALWHRWWNGSAWSNWETLNGILLGRPECVSWGRGRIDCFVVGTDQAMHRRAFDGTAWRGWERLGGAIASDISCTTWSVGRFDCFARGTDGALVHVWEDKSGFVGDADVGGAVLTTRTTPVDDPMRQWRVLNTETVAANAEYGLVNLRRLAAYRESQLGYRRIKSSGGMASVFGVDMEISDWMGASGGYFIFKHQLAEGVRDHRTNVPIHDTQVLAIYNTNAKKYLQNAGGWSSKPAFEWVVRRRVGADFALFNTKARAYLVLDESNQEKLKFAAQQ